MNGVRYYTATEAGRILGRTRQWVSLMVQSGMIKAERFGPLFMIPAAQINKLKVKLEGRRSKGHKNFFSKRRRIKGNGEVVDKEG